MQSAGEARATSVASRPRCACLAVQVSAHHDADRHLPCNACRTSHCARRWSSSSSSTTFYYGRHHCRPATASAVAVTSGLVCLSVSHYRDFCLVTPVNHGTLRSIHAALSCAVVSISLQLYLKLAAIYPLFSQDLFPVCSLVSHSFCDLPASIAVIFLHITVPNLSKHLIRSFLSLSFYIKTRF